VISQPSTSHMMQFRVVPGKARPSRSLCSAYMGSWLDHGAAKMEMPGGRHRMPSSDAVEGEPFRLELPSSDALTNVRRLIEDGIDAVKKAEVDAHRPERRLQTGLDDEAIALCNDLRGKRTRADAKFREDMERAESKSRKASVEKKQSFVRKTSLSLVRSKGRNSGEGDGHGSSGDGAHEEILSPMLSPTASETATSPSRISRLRTSSLVSTEGEAEPPPSSRSNRASFAEMSSPSSPLPELSPRASRSSRSSFSLLSPLRLSISGGDGEEPFSRGSSRRDNTEATLKLVAQRESSGPAAPPRGGKGWEVFA